mmetsp:Transcript_12740/g.31102  ORF Transcript_12740/g.31102 Transcript_12740/m.31102 type:complete len:164 (-) Transcript_12740:283-774(-)|eukprot:CAMPEP_0181107156 /NCGR_PEP_ID=MMETSP1071-20121207/16928_1 /TAXON_ID=35127 /ORGANISM="Thalassiosira sp., Strain NH16" /LENGTH=163 /DNA_ID=CAMNT_0023190637 /DNA_START=185 /DNA_END=676 /DNA_ORIENTATION=+
MTEALQNSFASWLNDDTVHTECLHVPLTQDECVCGVGASLALVHDPPLYIPSSHYTYITIIDFVEPNSPADRAGLIGDDVVVEVNGTRLDDGQRLYVPDDVADMIRGPRGSGVSVVVMRDGNRRIKVDLVREPLDAARLRANAPLLSTMMMESVALKIPRKVL